jgi:MoaA/NifB/PqqE/SkfB family radical SAM enzyme
MLNLILKNKPHLFEAIEIETTSNCNRRCVYCPNRLYFHGSHLMQENLYKKIIDELAEIKYEGSIFPHHYGEPLTDNRLENLVRYTKTKLPKCKIELYSNGDLLTLTRFHNLLDAGVDLFRITNHDNTTPKNIKEILKEPIAKEKLYFYALNPQKIPLFNRAGLVKPKTPITFKKCQLCNHLVIDYRGNIVLCCNDYLSTQIFGNAKNSKIKDIWFQPKYVKLRHSINKGKFDLAICQICSSHH